MKKPLDLHLKFCSGNIVEWCDELYIVAVIYEDSLTLLPLDSSNISCHPSTTWPYLGNSRKPDKKRTVQSVKHVADCVHDYMVEQMTKATRSIKRKGKDDDDDDDENERRGLL